VSFSTTPILSHFTGADESPLSESSAWSHVGTVTAACKRVSNQAAGSVTTTSMSLWAGLTTLTDAEAYATIAALTGDLVDDFAGSSAPLAGRISWQHFGGTTSDCQTDGSGHCGGSVSTTSQTEWQQALADSIVYGTITTLAGAGNPIGVVARGQGGVAGDATGNNCYIAVYNQGTGVQLFKIVGGASTQLGSTVAVTLSAGDKIKIVCTGTTIQAWYFHSGSWTLAASVTDSAFSSGFPGVRIRGTTGRLDDFSGFYAYDIGIVVRASTSGSANTGQSGYNAQAFEDGTINLLKLGTTVTQLATTSLGHNLGVGDKIGIQAIGSTITVWYQQSGGSWTQVISTTDSTFSGGLCAIRLRGLVLRLDDFGGGAPNIFPTLPFISSVTTVHSPDLQGYVDVPFIGSVSAVYAPTLTGVSTEIDLPFISSVTQVYGIMSLYFADIEGTGRGNGGELFHVLLAPNGTSETATLAANLSDTGTLLELTGDSGFPSSGEFVVAIDDEVLLVSVIGGGAYWIRGRAMSNTTAAAHTAGADVVWGDSYDMAIIAAATIAADFTADIASSGSITYPGWLMCFDASQAYESGDKYPFHVTSVLGVFDAGSGSTGSNRCDAAQPNAICTPAGVSDDCPAALSNPSRIQTDISIGDVALVRYTNPEASILELGPRSVSLQSWFGLKRVDDSDTDVTFTDPNGHVIDGTVDGVWDDPLGPGISPVTGEPTTTDVPYTSTTLPGSDRTFTHGPPGYNENGWPIAVLAVRQGRRRVPFWQSFDYHNFNWVYCGFAVDATFCQIVINRNGVDIASEPEVELPGPQDIDGPDAVWDDGSYRFAACLCVAIFGTPYLVAGPSIGGTLVGFGSLGGNLPVADFNPDFTVIITIPPAVEGGQGGGINPPSGGLHVWSRI